MPAEVKKPGRYLEWDSAFFGCRVGQSTTAHLTPGVVQRIDGWCIANKIDCLYLLADAGERATLRIAQEHGFVLVDLRVSFELPLDGTQACPNRTSRVVVRPWCQSDLPTLKEIARVSHRETRFYADPNFDDALCDAFYATWIENSCHGYADAVFVPECEQQPCGYVTCHVRGQKTGQIGLIGLGSHIRGKGIGRTMINEALHWFAAQGVTRVTVTTQGANLDAVRFYERCGFMTSSLQFWFHRWQETVALRRSR